MNERYTLYTAIEDNGDGSSSTRIFRTEEERDKFCDENWYFGAYPCSGPLPEPEDQHFEIIDGVLTPSSGFDTLEEPE